MKLRSLIALALVLPAANAAAQSSETQQSPAPAVAVPSHNSEHWTFVPQSEGGFALNHDLSGAFCVDTFRELRLVDVRSYAPDGTDVSCSFIKGNGDDRTTLTTYFFRKEGVTGPASHRQAIGAIIQRGETTALQVAYNEDHTERCRQNATPRVAEQVLLRERAGNDEAVSSTFAMGVAVFDFTYESGKAARSALMTYELDGWIIKVRLTTPAGEGDEGYAYACGYSGLAASGTARVLDIEETS